MPFSPYTPEPMITAEISKREMKVIVALRKLDFGKIIVEKLGGKVVMIRKEQSFKIDDGDQLDVL